MKTGNDTSAAPKVDLSGWRRVVRLRRPAASDWLVGGLVLLVYAGVQAAFLQGPYPFDPAKYFRTAVHFPDVPANLWTLRIGVVIPVAAAVRIFGPSEAALYTVPFLVGLMLAGAVYGAMVLLFRDRVLAAGAALVTVLNVNFLLKSSSIVPDTTATATFAAGFLCLVAAARRDPKRAWLPVAFAAGAGVLFGWTYLAREFSLVLLPAVVACLLLLRLPLRRAAVLLGAALVTAGLEFLWGLLRYQEPLIHARILREERERPPTKSAAVVENVREQTDSLLETIVAFPRLLLAWRSGWLLLALIAVFLVALALRFRDRRLWLLAAWGFSFWIAMAVLGVAELPSGRWVVNVTLIRYWYPVIPPLVMGAFGGLALLIPGGRRLPGGVGLMHASAALAAALVLVPAFIEFRHCEEKRVWVNDPAERWYELRSWFATPEADRYTVIGTDGKTARLVPAFASSRFGRRLWDGAVYTAHGPDGLVLALRGLPRSLILVHRGVSRQATRLDEVRREWSPVFVSKDRTMMLLAHASGRGGDTPASAERWWRRLSAPGPNSAEPGTCGRPYVRPPERKQRS